MIRLGMMLAAAVAISTAGGSAHAKIAIETFPVPTGAGSRARRYSLVHRAAGGQTRKGEVWGAESGADKLFVLRSQ